MSVRPSLQELWKRRDCSVAPPFGEPALPEGIVLPDDLLEFYRLCGGADLFVGSEHALRILGPMEFAPADPVIFGRALPQSASATWWVIARRAGDAFITIDLDPARSGRCYDSAWDRHGVAGNCPVVSRSFTNLLATLASRGSGEPWWNDPSWPRLGDALD
ncbi:MAG TPA: SMI1/KNR4 family protein [Thermoanaerobaculia bacterium]|nr:SMI1/KNR4 family protein [Thermoanaerobaculia bacterium]